MTIERENLLQQLEPYYFNSWIVNEVADFILALEPGYQECVLGWVLSVAQTQPEIGKLPYRISEIYRGLTS